MADVVVVGAGIVGASVALHLAETGAEVVVVDAGRTGRATLAGAGIVPAATVAPASPLEALRSRAAAAYPALAARAGGAGYQVVGELVVEVPGRQLEAAAEDAVAAHGKGTAVLGPGEAAGSFPYLDPSLGAVWIPGTARVDGEALRVGLLEAAVAAGAAVRTGEAAVAAGARSVEGAVVAGERVGAGAVVLAAGAWTAALAAGAGVRVPVEPQRGQIAHFGVEEDTSSMPVVARVGRWHYLVTFGDRRVVAGATREAGSGFDPRLTAAGVAEVVTEALAVAPGLAGATLRELRVGLRPTTPDLLPLLGPVPGVGGLFLATGMGSGGLTLGPYCGRLVADAVAGRAAQVDLAPFGLGRFG
ncbi:MAG: NAD(P)/FAD-dependent oxidoreductase [Acidimicrobiales bacterium]